MSANTRFLVPHSEYGDPNCPGIIMTEERGEVSDLTCNDCGVVVLSVPGNEAESTLIQMSLALGSCSETCPHCGSMNIFTGFHTMEAYTCRYCHTGVVVQRKIQ